jgi:DNA-binding NarL/FixJ family response regulator
MTAETPAPPKHRILIVDDHPLFRDGLRRFIEAQPDLTCCGQADSRPTALAALAASRPDLVILDLRLRGEDGADLLGELLRQQPGLRVLILSQKDQAVHAEPLLRAGARGYIMKEEATEELLIAVRTVLLDNLYVGHRLSALVLHRFFRGTPGDGVAEKLTKRELQVFQFLGSGQGTQEIARQLNLSVKTVEAHRENIKRKLGCADAAELVHAAHQWVQATEC